MKKKKQTLTEERVSSDSELFQLDIAETGGQGGSEIIIIESDDVEVEKGSEIKGHGTG